MYSDEGVSVWFGCKLCPSFFVKVEDIVNHKKKFHFDEYQRTKFIIFEERDSPTSKPENWISTSSTKKEEPQFKSKANNSKCNWNSETAGSHNTLTCGHRALQSPHNPYVHLKRLHLRGAQSASCNSNFNPDVDFVRDADSITHTDNNFDHDIELSEEETMDDGTYNNNQNSSGDTSFTTSASETVLLPVITPKATTSTSSPVFLKCKYCCKKINSGFFKTHLRTCKIKNDDPNTNQQSNASFNFNPNPDPDPGSIMQASSNASDLVEIFKTEFTADVTEDNAFLDGVDLDSDVTASSLTFAGESSNNFASNFAGINSISQNSHLETSSSPFNWDFKEILISQWKREGRNLIKSVEDSQVITISQRKLITSTAARFLTSTFGSYPSGEAKESMAVSIHVAFPCVRKEAWYSKTKGSNATGYLEYRIGNARNKTSDKKTKKRSQAKVTSAIIQADRISLEDVEKRRNWLMDYNKPTETVTQYLDETFWSRKKSFGDGAVEGSIVSHWPCLLDSAQSVSLEYERYPEFKSSTGHLYAKFPDLAPKILFYASQNNINIFEKLGLDSEMFSEKTPDGLYQDINEMDLNDPCRIYGNKAILASLMILPFIFNAGFAMVEKKRRKVSNCVSVKTMIQFLAVGTNLTTYLEKEQTRSQPFLVFLGNKTTLDVQQSFVMAERRLIECGSITQAIDTCFKVHKILHAKWSTEVAAVWEFLESFVYELGTVKSSHQLLRSFLK